MKTHWKLPLALVVIAAVATGVTLNKAARGHVLGVLRQLSHSTAHAAEEPPDKSWIKAGAGREKTPWDRTLILTKEQIQGLGLTTARVRAQTEPTVLPLFGRTEYDPATISQVRTQFDSRIDNVIVGLGSKVQKGDPLMELFSTELAAAKSDYEMECSRWDRDKKVLAYKRPLALDNTIPRKELIEIENEERLSQLKMKLARDKLLVYGLTDTEIQNAPQEDGVHKAKMILRAQADGVVVKRPLVKGNYYTSNDELMTIAPLEHLWVQGGVSESDADKLHVGQNLKVIFPFSVSEQPIMAKIDYIDYAIDPETRSAKFRTTITNPGGRLKAGAFVKIEVQIRPKEGRTVVPRSAMVSVNRSDYVFIRRPGQANQYERRPISVARERNDVVIVAAPAEGSRELVPGEEVVTTASLILEEMYENRTMIEGGLLVSEPAQELLDRFRSPHAAVSAPTP